MNPDEAPAFIREKRTLPPRGNLKTVRKRAKEQALRVDGDTGTPQMKERQRVVLEVRGRSSTGHATSVGARVESQFPIDRHKNRKELDPTNAWRNVRMWEASERLRTGLRRIGHGAQDLRNLPAARHRRRKRWDADHKIDAFKRYKKAIGAVGESLRPIIFWVCIAGEPAIAGPRRNGMQSSMLALQSCVSHLRNSRIITDT